MGVVHDPPARPERHPTHPPGPTEFTLRRVIAIGALLGGLYLLYELRGVVASLVAALILAYALDPFVDRLEGLRLPRPLAAIVVMVGIFAAAVSLIMFGVPLFVDEIRDVGEALPGQLANLGARIDPWLWALFKVHVPHSLAELTRTYGSKVQGELPTMFSAGVTALFGTIGYVSVVLSALVVPVFALYLLIDFDHIVRRARHLIPRRWVKPVTEVAGEIHETLGSYVRGQFTANIVLGALYAAGLRIVDIRLSVPIGVLTGMLAFVPYVGFSIGLIVALSMAVLDWHGVGPVLGVLGVMGTVQVLDSFLITPRIVGRSVGLAPLEVLITMSAAASLMGFVGVLLAVPVGAIVKILVSRSVRAYVDSDFYLRPSTRPPSSPQL